MTDPKSCEHCEYFLKSDGEPMRAGTIEGQCRRFPPTPMLVNQDAILGGATSGIVGVYPPAAIACGEYKISSDFILKNPSRSSQ